MATYTYFQYFSPDNSYYTGYPVDILFLWTCVLFSVSVSDHIKVFKREKKAQRYFDQEEMRQILFDFHFWQTTLK